MPQGAWRSRYLHGSRTPQPKECGFGCAGANSNGIQNSVIAAARLNATSAGEWQRQQLLPACFNGNLYFS